MQTDLLIALLDIEIEMCVFMFNNNPLVELKS